MRNDSSLYTGITSATNAAELKARRTKKQQDKKEKVVKLTPVEELIFELLDNELGNTRAELIKAIGNEQDITVVKNKVDSGRLYIESVSQLKSKLRNILRGR